MAEEVMLELERISGSDCVLSTGWRMEGPATHGAGGQALTPHLAELGAN